MPNLNRGLGTSFNTLVGCSWSRNFPPFVSSFRWLLCLWKCFCNLKITRKSLVNYCNIAIFIGVTSFWILPSVKMYFSKAQESYFVIIWFLMCDNLIFNLESFDLWSFNSWFVVIWFLIWHHLISYLGSFDLQSFNSCSLYRWRWII